MSEQTNENREIQIGRNQLGHLCLINNPLEDLAEGIIYIAHTAGLPEDQVNNLVEQVCEITKVYRFNSIVKTAVKAYSEEIIARLKQDKNMNYGPPHHLYTKMLVTALRAGMSLSRAHRFCVVVKELFEKSECTGKSIIMTLGIFDESPECIWIKLKEDGFLKLYELKPANENGEGSYLLVYPKESAYAKVIERDIAGAYFS